MLDVGWTSGDEDRKVCWSLPGTESVMAGWWCLPVVVGPGHGVFRKWRLEVFHVISNVFCDLRLEVVSTQRLCQCECFIVLWHPGDKSRLLGKGS